MPLQSQGLSSFWALAISRVLLKNLSSHPSPNHYLPASEPLLVRTPAPARLRPMDRQYSRMVITPTQ